MADGEFKIEKGVPVPSDGREQRTRYPFADMEIGDSFFVALKKGDAPDPVRNRLTNAASNYGSRHNKRFTVRKVENGFRVWRVALSKESE